MRFPKLPARKDSPEREEQDFQDDQPVAEQEAPGVTYGSVAMPDLPPPPLTSELTRSIRFTVSEPQGYFFEQVENFVQQVVDALHYYEQAEFAWRQAVYEMQVEMDQQAYDLQRVRSEIELFKVQGSPLVNPDGSYVTESQQANGEMLASELAQVQTQLAEMTLAVAERDEEVVRLRELAAAQDHDIVSLRQWGEQMFADYQLMQAELEAASSGGTAELSDEPLTADGADVLSGDGAQSTDVQTVGLPTVVLPSVEADNTDEVLDDEDDEDYEDHEDVAEVDHDVSEHHQISLDGAEDYEPAHAKTNESEEARSMTAEPVVTEAEVAAPAHGPEQTDDMVDQSGTGGTQVSTYSLDEAESQVASSPDGNMEPEVAVLDDDEDGHDDDDPAISVPVVPVDTELPEGTVLPGTGENAITYPPAAPGIPLDTQGVPVEVWAPELSNRLRDTDASAPDKGGDATSTVTSEADADEADLSSTSSATGTEDPMTEPGDAPDSFDVGSHDAVPTETVPVEPAHMTASDSEVHLSAHSRQDEDPVADDDTEPNVEDAAEGLSTEDVEHDVVASESPHDAEDAEDEYGTSVAVVPVDSELPEGVRLPGTGENAITYPPAAPGIPLDTQGVPVEVWAPELNPKLRAALEADKREHDAEEASSDDVEAMEHEESDEGQ